jgi:peptide deformylase
VENLTDAQAVITDLWDSLPTTGLGLAAPQIGSDLRIFVARVNGLEVAMINPYIVKSSGSFLADEGCFSLPGRMFTVRRFKIVKIRGWVNGIQRTVNGHDNLAVVLQHELDHLDGRMIDETSWAEHGGRVR